MAELKNLIVEGDTRLVGDTNAGKITATSIKTSGGTASQFVKGDGSLDSKVYTPLFNSTTTFDFSTTTPVAGIHRAYGITNPVTGQTEYGSVISGPNTGSTGSPTAQIVVSGIAGQTNHVHGYIRRLTDNGWTPWSTIVDNHNYSAVIPTATTSTSGIMSSSDKTALNSKVTGPASSTANRIATFSDTTGKVIKDSGYTISTSVPSGAVFTDTHRPIQMNGTQILASNTTPLNLKAGKNIKLSNSSGTVTIENGCYVIYADYNDLGGGWWGKPSGSELFEDIENGKCLGLVVYNEPDYDFDFYVPGHFTNDEESHFFYRYFSGSNLVTRRMILEDGGTIAKFDQITIEATEYEDFPIGE